MSALGQKLPWRGLSGMCALPRKLPRLLPTGVYLWARNRHRLMNVRYWRLVDPFPYKLRRLRGIGCRTRCRVSQFVAHELELPLLVSSVPVGE